MYTHFCDDLRLKRFFEYFLGKQFKGIFIFPNSRIMEIKKSQKIPKNPKKSQLFSTAQNATTIPSAKKILTNIA